MSSTPSQTVEAAVGETTTCTITITETDQAVLVNSGTAPLATDQLIQIDETNTTLIAPGTVLTNGSTGEKIKVIQTPNATTLIVTRGVEGTIAQAMADNQQLIYRAAATANSPKTCMGDTTNDMTVTVKSADAGYTAKIAVDRFTHAAGVQSPTITLSALTKADPGAATAAAAHGLATGDRVIFAGSNMTELNGKIFTATVTAATTFTIGVNTSGYGNVANSGTFFAVSGTGQGTEYRINAGTLTAGTTTITLDNTDGIAANSYVLVNSEIMKVSAIASTTTLTVVRGQLGTTAAAFLNNAVVTPLSAMATDFADANQVVPKINGLAGSDTAAEAVTVSLDTFTAATATKAAYYSTTFTLSSATAGEAVIAVTGPNSGPKYITDPDTSSNLLHVNFRGAPVSYTDADVNGAFNAGDTARSVIDTAAAVGATTTHTIKINPRDTKGQELVGQVTYNLDADACAAGVTWSGSGKCDLVITTTNAPGTDSGWESVIVKGLPKTGNFRYTYTATYSGASGDFDFANSTDAADMVLYRTNNKVASLTSSLKKAASDNAEAATDAVQTNGIPAVAANADELYYVEVVATDSAGNPAAASITVKDLDGDGTDGLGTSLDISFEETGDVAVTKVTAGANGKALFWVRHATVYTASATDPVLGTYPLEFYYTSDKTIKTNITVDVRSAAKNFALAATSGQSADGSLPTGTVGTWTLTATDINGTRIAADVATTFIVTGMGTGATAGSFIPTDNALTVDDVKGGVISIVAPTVAGTGTIAVIYGGKVVASTTLTFGAPATAGSATVSGTGCTGSSTGSYTCVVTEGGTAAEVATASGAVSVWQSDANGVLQGYVVGTPDFVDTGLASTADIADNSAVIVVR
jgi:hypothetical protein